MRLIPLYIQIGGKMRLSSALDGFVLEFSESFLFQFSSVQFGNNINVSRHIHVYHASPIIQDYDGCAHAIVIADKHD